MDYTYLRSLYAFFVQDTHFIPLTEKMEGLFRDFGFRGLTIRGPCTSASSNVLARSELDTTTPNRLLWIPSHNEEGVIYFYEVDFTNDMLFRHIIKTYESIIIGDSSARIMPLHDVILPIFPVMTPNHLLPLSSLQLYACVFTQSMLDAISTFPVHTLVLTGYAVAISETTKNSLLVNSRVCVLMISILSKYATTINLSQVTNLDYFALGCSLTAKNAAGPSESLYEQLVISTLGELYVIAEGYRTNVKTLSLLLTTSDLMTRSMMGVFRSLAIVNKLILGYNTCGTQCPLRSMQHCISPECMPASTKQLANNVSEGSEKPDFFIRIFELCAEKGIRHFALDSEMSKHLENKLFAAFAPYVDTMECEFITGNKMGAKYVPLNYALVSDFETFSWTDSALSGTESQRLQPLSGKARRAIAIDPRLEWLNNSYIVVNRNNIVSLPKEGVVLLDVKTQESILSSKPASATTSWNPIRWFF